MVMLRNRITSARSGGPRRFSELRNKLMIESPNSSAARDVISELDRYNMDGRSLSNAPIVVAEPRDGMGNVIDEYRKREQDDRGVRQAASDVESGIDGVVEATSSVIEATSGLLDTVKEFSGVSIADFAYTYADYGPENLRHSPFEMDTLSESEMFDESETLDDLERELNLPEAWEETRGENSIVAIFDTAYAQGMFDDSRVVATFHADEVDSVYRPTEGHGTMCAGAAVANKQDGVPYNGAAPDADIILVRTTDNDGQIRGDVIAEAWDWIMESDFDRPVITNHSYGVPLCSGRPRGNFCQTPDADMVRVANSHRNITSIYAAGNEAGTCGRRPSGITNAITGVNSLPDVITVGALRFSGREAQRYSSHGRGDCAPVADPKPNVSAPLPRYTYYSTSNGWEIKDMRSGIGGSAGGTSHAAPTVAGIVALLQSKSMDVNGEPLTTEEVKQIIHKTAEPPRRTHINMFDGLLGQNGYDARFGHGQINILNALEEV